MFGACGQGGAPAPVAAVALVDSALSSPPVACRNRRRVAITEPRRRCAPPDIASGRPRAVFNSYEFLHMTFLAYDLI
jgi:hypothetical protein